jgi:hypothetical protein
MLYHRFDADSKIYIESIESEEQLENSTDRKLPDITEHYTVAFIDGEWLSVLKPELEIINNKIEVKQLAEEVVQEEVVQEEVVQEVQEE